MNLSLWKDRRSLIFLVCLHPQSGLETHRLVLEMLLCSCAPGGLTGVPVFAPACRFDAFAVVAVAGTGALFSVPDQAVPVSRVVVSSVPVLE